MSFDIKQYGCLVQVYDTNGVLNSFIGERNLRITHKDDEYFVVLNGSYVELYDENAHCIPSLELGKNGEYLYTDNEEE